MAYFIQYNGREVRCETADDVRSLLGDPDESGPSITSAVRAKEKVGRVPQGNGTPKRFGKLVSKLDDKQKAVLNVIASHDVISAEDLCKQLGFQSNRHLAAQMVGITKAAKSIGMNSPIHTIAKRSRASGRAYEYQLSGDAQQVKEALGKAQQ